jgi:hypothetical protein
MSPSWRAASFVTDKGPVAALFFAGADQVRGEYRKARRGMYSYRFHHVPHPGVLDRGLIDYPEHWQARRDWMVVSFDRRAGTALAAAGFRDVTPPVPPRPDPSLGCRNRMSPEVAPPAPSSQPPRS